MNISNHTQKQMLSEITEIKELIHPHDVNSHIKEGWKLLNTFQAINSQETLMVKYCVGWPKSADAISAQKNIIEQKQHTDRKRFIYSL